MKVTVEHKHPNGTGWYVRHPEWMMQPVGRIGADDAERVCRTVAEALNAFPVGECVYVDGCKHQTICAAGSRCVRTDTLRQAGTFMGWQMFTDGNMPPNILQFRSPAGAVLGTLKLT